MLSTVILEFFFITSVSRRQLDIVGLDKYREFGPVVRETVLPGTDIVWLFDPVDIRDCGGFA